MTREPIYAALFALVQNALPAGFTTVRRQVPRLIFDQDRAKMPALYMVQAKEEPQQMRKGVPPIWKFSVQLYIFAMADGVEDATPMKDINPLIDAVADAICPVSIENFTQTLGGLVSHCWLSGATQIIEGLDSATCAVLLEVQILVPD